MPSPSPLPLMDPPSSEGEQAVSYTSVHPSGPGEQSTPMPGLAEKGVPCVLSSTSTTLYSPSSGIVPLYLLSAHQPQSTQPLPAQSDQTSAPMSSHRPVTIKTEQSWPTPPLDTDDCDSFVGKVSPLPEDISYCKLSPSSPEAWPSPPPGFQQLANWCQLHQEVKPADQPLYTSLPALERTPYSSSSSPTYVARVKEEVDSVDEKPISQSPYLGMSFDFTPINMSPATLAPTTLGPLDAASGLHGHIETTRDDKSLFDHFGSIGSLLNSSQDATQRLLDDYSHSMQPRLEGPYAWLIYKALLSRPSHAMTLQEIYQWFRENTTKASNHSKGWQNSIRHNLSMNAAFTNRDSSGSDNAKRSAEWVLEDWAARDGVQSTTRYRKGSSSRRHYAMRSLTQPPRRGVRSSQSLRVPTWASPYGQTMNQAIALPPTSHCAISQPQPYSAQQLLMPSLFTTEDLVNPHIKQELDSMPPTPDLTLADSLNLLLPNSTLPTPSSALELPTLNCGGNDDIALDIGRGVFPYTMDDVQLPYATRHHDADSTTDSCPLFAPFDGITDWEEKP